MINDGITFSVKKILLFSNNFEICILRFMSRGYRSTIFLFPYLFFCDEDLQSYDTNLKVNPPLRKREDMMALRDAVMDGTVDCIASHHLPQNWDAKTCEFEYAKNGMIGLQTAYAVVQTVLPELSAQKIAELFSINVANIFNLNVMKIEEGKPVELTIFNNNDFTLKKENIKSKSFNSAFINKDLKGKVLGIVSKGNLILNN